MALVFRVHLWHENIWFRPFKESKCMKFNPVSDAEEACRPAELPTGLERVKNQFAIGTGDCKPGYTTSCIPLEALQCQQTGGKLCTSYRPEYASANTSRLAVGPKANTDGHVSLADTMSVIAKSKD